jgi:ankyrin repeat protein
MPTIITPIPLPSEASFEQLRKQAKQLRDFAGTGVEGALELVGAHHPKGAHAVTLAGAQLVVAHHYGFSSWAKLKHHLEVVNHYRRSPDEVGADEVPTAADEFLTLACLRYGGDDTADRWARAAQLLDADPSMTRSNVYVAAAAADVSAMRALLADDPSLASREGGPYAWEPLLYLAHSRVVARDDTDSLDVARLLLDHGADPNAGYLWHGLIPAYTAITGALGGGEGDQPQHPHGFAFATLLLEAGADANDGQALYDRQFGADDSHLVLLFKYGLGQGDGGPWRARLGDKTDSPDKLLRGQLWWAIVHDMRERVRLLVDHGVDIRTPYPAGGRPFGLYWPKARTPAEVAAFAGCAQLVDWLVARGATRPESEGVDGLVAAALNNDRETVDRLRGFVDDARAERPGLIVWAAARKKLDAIPLLVSLGFDIDALARSDIPAEQPWDTALHEAAGSGDVELARMLLDLGADPTIEDGRFHSTPIGWAEHFEQTEMIEFLRSRQ